MDRKGIIAFILITFGAAWCIWSIAWLCGLRASNGLAFQAAILPGTFSPALAAVLVRKYITRQGMAVTSLCINLRRWPLYLLGWYLPVAVIAGVVLLAYGFNLSLPDYSLQRGFVEITGTSAPEGLRFFHVLLLAAAGVPLLTPLMLGEELGWRGYLQLRLFPGRPILAAMGTGIVWALWQSPLYLAGYYFDIGAGYSFLLIIVLAILLSILFGWLQQRTGSVWAPALAHAATNFLGVNLAAVLFAGGPNYVWLSYGGILSLIPLCLLCLFIGVSEKQLAAGPESASQVLGNRS
jgi:uncharacterized protein